VLVGTGMATHAAGLDCKNGTSGRRLRIGRAKTSPYFNDFVELALFVRVRRQHFVCLVWTGKAVKKGAMATQVLLVGDEGLMIIISKRETVLALGTPRISWSGRIPALKAKPESPRRHRGRQAARPQRRGNEVL
jgi:hypothetical protein